MILWVPGRLPGLNELLNGKGVGNGKWNAYNEQKCMWYGQIKLLVVTKGIQKQGPGYATFLFCEPNQKRDPDNIVGGGVKLLLDSLAGAGVIPGDGWDSNLGFVGYWKRKADRVGCLVHWSPSGVTSKETMEVLLEKELEEANGNPSRKNRDGSGAGSDARLGAHAQKIAKRNAAARRGMGKRPAMGG